MAVQTVPDELLLKIFALLTDRDDKICLLHVSRRWRRVGLDRVLWRDETAMHLLEAVELASVVTGTADEHDLRINLRINANDADWLQGSRLQRGRWPQGNMHTLVRTLRFTSNVPSGSIENVLRMLSGGVLEELDIASYLDYTDCERVARTLAVVNYPSLTSLMLPDTFRCSPKTFAAACVPHRVPRLTYIRAKSITFEVDDMECRNIPSSVTALDVAEIGRDTRPLPLLRELRMENESRRLSQVMFPVSAVVVPNLETLFITERCDSDSLFGRGVRMNWCLAAMEQRPCLRVIVVVVHCKPDEIRRMHQRTTFGQLPFTTVNADPLKQSNGAPRDAADDTECSQPLDGGLRVCIWRWGDHRMIYKLFRAGL